MNFATLSTAFKLSEQPDLFLALDSKIGLTVKRDIERKASCNEVFARVATLLADSLNSPSNHSLDACFRLREQLRQYEHTNPLIEPSITKQVHALFAVVILKAATEDKTASLTPLLTRANSQFPEMSAEEFTYCLMGALKGLADHYQTPSERNKLLPKRPFGALREKALVYLSGRMGDKSSKLFDLDTTIFSVTLAWWEAKAKQQAKTPDANSLYAESLLCRKVDKPTNKDFETLTFPRDILYTEKMTLYHVMSLCTTDLILVRRVCALLKMGLEVSYEKATPTRQAIVFHIEQTGILEIGLLLQTKKAALRIVKHGIDLSTEALIRKLLAYKEEKTSNLSFFDLCIEMLTINELLYKKANLHDEWPRFHCAGTVLTYKDPSERFFNTKSYLPRKRLKFLYTTGNYLHKCFHNSSTPLELEPLQERETISILYTKIFRDTTPSFLNADDTLLYEKLAGKIVECRNNSRQKTNIFCNYEQIAFENETLGHEYVWNLTDIGSYKTILDAIARVHKGITVKVPFLLKKIPSSGQDSGKSFLEDLQQPAAPTKATTKRKKPPSSSRSPSPPTTGDLTSAFANMALSDSPKPPKVLPEAALPPEKPPVVIKKPAKQPKTLADLLYAPRVTDWFCPPGSKRDPFVKDPKYSAVTYSAVEKYWIRTRHSFAHAVDKYLAVGIETTDQATLKLYKAKRRIQLVGDITVTSNLITQTKTGIFTYSIGKTGRIFHRWFTPKNSKEIVSPEAKKGWDVLSEVQPEDATAEKDEMIAEDKSYVESETENLAVIVDPKNNARIRIVRLIALEK